MTDAGADDSPVEPTAGATGDDDIDRMTEAVSGLALCVLALQFTIVGVFDGSSFLAILAGLGLGGSGVVKALNA